MGTIDPRSAALYALIAICLVLIGALLTPGSVPLEQRGAVLGGIVVVLGAIGWRMRHHE
jgi:hypothetical protein